MHLKLVYMLLKAKLIEFAFDSSSLIIKNGNKMGIKWEQNRNKMETKWEQNGNKIGPNRNKMGTKWDLIRIFEIFTIVTLVSEPIFV